MKATATILLTTIQTKWISLLGIVLAFFMPITGMVLAVGFAIFLDTITGIWKSRKNGVPISSRRLSAVISKMFLYQLTIILFFLIDWFILNEILKSIFTTELLLTKVLSLVLISIEVVSINENYKAVRGIDLWASLKRLLSRAKELKNDSDEIRHQ
jgi:hypothetical protein